MTSTIESVDNLPKLPVHDRVNETERSSPEDQRKQFKKALKDTMQEDQRKEEARRKTDSAVVESSSADHEQAQHGPVQAANPDSDSEGVNENSQQKATVEKHIDVKA